MMKYNQRLEALEQRCNQGTRIVWVNTNETPEEAATRAGSYEGTTIFIGWQKSRTPNELCEAKHGQRLDTRAASTTSGANQELETVGAIDGTEDSGR